MLKGINKKPELGGDHKTTERDVANSAKNQSASRGKRYSDSKCNKTSRIPYSTGQEV